MKAKKVQRIKLQLMGNPVKLDATIMDMSEDGHKIRVEFDSPLKDAVLYAWNDRLLVDRELKEGETPSAFSDIRIFTVL